MYLGNTKARRDWGFAGDYVQAMWRMLQQDQPGDYVVATGEDHAVGEWIFAVFRRLDLDPDRYVRLDERYLRPTEVDVLRGDAAKALERLGWRPRVGFDDLVEMMVAADLRLAQRELVLKQAGHEQPPPVEDAR